MTPRTLLLHRSYYHYLGSQLSGFVNPYYVYLALNSLCWIAAAACIYGLTLRVSQRRVPAQFAAALVCVGNGFCYFVAQPKFYMAGYAVVVMCLYAFEVLTAPDGVKPWSRTLLLGVLLGLSALVYDLQPTLLGLLPYAIFRKRSLPRTLTALALACSIPLLWSRLQHGYLGLPIDRSNAALAEDTLTNIRLLFSHPEKGKLYWLFVNAFSVFTQNLSYAFMLVALCLGGAGVLLARRSSDRWLPVVLLFPALALNIALAIGRVKWHQWYVVEFARFTYIAYPAVYIAGAFALERIAGRSERWRWASAWACVACIGFWQNADAFGFVSPTYHFYFPELSKWLQNR